MQPYAQAPAVMGSTRSASLPPSTDTARPFSSTASASTLHRQALAPPSAPVLIRTTTDDFFNAVQDENDELDEAWGDLGGEAFFDAPSEAMDTQSSTPTPSFDDGGEPDFAGWLNAQAQAKLKKPLPKGLTKSSAFSNGRPVASGRTATTGSVTSNSSAQNPTGRDTKPIVISAKKINTKPKDAPDEVDGWGDAWD